MEKFEIEEIVKAMLGRYFQYGKDVIRVESYRNTDKVMTIHTDKVNLPIKNENFETEYKKFIPVESHLPATVQVGIQLETSIIGQNAQVLGDLIMDNIKRVKADPNYIPQANAINDLLKSMIDLGKTQVDMVKTQILSQKLSQ